MKSGICWLHIQTSMQNGEGSSQQEKEGQPWDPELATMVELKALNTYGCN